MLEQWISWSSETAHCKHSLFTFNLYIFFVCYTSAATLCDQSVLLSLTRERSTTLFQLLQLKSLGPSWDLIEFTKMYELLNKESVLSTSHSVTPCYIGSSHPWTSTDSHIHNPHAEQSCLSKSLSLKMAASSPYSKSSKQLGFHFQEQDLSPTQSSGQSYPEVASAVESNPYVPEMIATKSS